MTELVQEGVRGMEEASCDGVSLASGDGGSPPDDRGGTDAGTPLPFTVTARRGTHGTVCVVAEKDGQRVALERYTLGDREKRLAAATRLSKHPELAAAGALDKELIAKALEQVEIEVHDSDDGEESEDESPWMDCIMVPSLVGEKELVELAWNSEKNAPDFIVHNVEEGTFSRGATVEVDGRTLYVRDQFTGILTPGGDVPGCVLLPSDAQPHNQGKDDGSNTLVDEVRRHIERYVELPVGSVEVAVAYVFLTWVHDAFSELPYLAFRTADFGRGKSRALDVVGLICYRPIDGQWRKHGSGHTPYSGLVWWNASR